MKKRGFTLIELIAVIVVLAIIALIATPKIVRVIKDARREATERSAERYLDAVETAVADNKLKENNVIDGVYEVNKEGNLVIEGHEPLIVETSGDKPKEGSKVAIQNGQVISLGTNMTIGKYAVTIDDKGIATATLKDGSTTNSTMLCKAVEPTKQTIRSYYNQREVVAGVQATPENPYAYGAEYSCDLGDHFRTFYVLKEEGNTVKLIASESFAGVGGEGFDPEWDYNNWPSSIEDSLEQFTSKWPRLFNAGGKVELPSAYDIVTAVGIEDWDAKRIHLEDDNAWLFVNQQHDQYIYYAYWTSTYHPSYGAAWNMTGTGNLNPYISLSDYYPVAEMQVRPVIVISKSNMSL